MASIFGTHGEPYDTRQANDDGLTHHGIQRHTGQPASGTSHEHRIIDTSGHIVSGHDIDDVPAEARVPDPTRGIEHELETPLVGTTQETPDWVHAPGRSFWPPTN